MSCIDDRIETIIAAISRIGQPAEKGLMVALLQTAMTMPTVKAAQADTRLDICKACDRCTWLRLIDYAIHLNTHIDRVIQEGFLFSVFPELPVQPYAPGKELFCSILRAWLPARAAVETEQCPLNYWPKNDD